ncbi:MAG: uracil phosphoribosyltransferase [Planctomycetota bacterium]
MFRELEHAYGERARVLDDPFVATLLARVSSADTARSDVLHALRTVYGVLCAWSASELLPTTHGEFATRMHDQHGALGTWKGDVLDPASRVVVIDVIRGGIVPGQVCFELLSSVLPEDYVRFDHLHMSRTTDAAGHVTGSTLFGSKIGGRVEGAHLVIPDPMGATGSTACVALDHYLEHHGAPASVSVLPMICTPEFLRRVLDHPARPTVFAARVDRGMSSPDVLATKPGLRWSEERGLDDDDYIVPGAGGVGEVLNNSWC